MGDGSGDLQRIWHEYVADQILPHVAGRDAKALTILDAGAGVGRSKERLSRGVHRVTTQEINRAYMTQVDLICDLSELTRERKEFDVVTAFDVMEHAVRPFNFIGHLEQLATKLVFFSTPNRASYPGPWHFTGAQLSSHLQGIGARLTWHCRYQRDGKDWIEEVPIDRFIVDKPQAHSFGVGIWR